MKAAEQLVHPFPPVWDKSSVILILGSFPSVKSPEPVLASCRRSV